MAKAEATVGLEEEGGGGRRSADGKAGRAAATETIEGASLVEKKSGRADKLNKQKE